MKAGLDKHMKSLGMQSVNSARVSGNHVEKAKAQVILNHKGKI
jgi:hypothetical protein